MQEKKIHQNFFTREKERETDNIFVVRENNQNGRNGDKFIVNGCE